MFSFSATRIPHRDSTYCTLSFNCVQVQTLPTAHCHHCHLHHFYGIRRLDLHQLCFVRVLLLNQFESVRRLVRLQSYHIRNLTLRRCCTGRRLVLDPMCSLLLLALHPCCFNPSLSPQCSLHPPSHAALIWIRLSADSASIFLRVSTCWPHFCTASP